MRELTRLNKLKDQIDAAFRSSQTFWNSCPEPWHDEIAEIHCNLEDSRDVLSDLIKRVKSSNTDEAEGRDERR